MSVHLAVRQQAVARSIGVDFAIMASVMKVVILYRPASEHATSIEGFAEDFIRVHADRHLELVSVDTRDGASLATLYDVVSYPAVLALGDDGQLLQYWQGDNLPLMNELAYYAHSA